MMLNIVSTSVASSLVVSAARPAAQAAGRNIAQRSASRSIATESNAVKPYSRKLEVQAQEQTARDIAAKDALERAQQIIGMNQAFAKNPGYSHVSSMHTPPAIPNLATQQAAQTITKAEANSTLSQFASADELYLGGSLASVLAVFGFGALKDQEVIDEAKAQAVKDIIPSIEEKIVPISDQEFATLSDFIAKHGYTDPKAAISNLYNNPSGETFLNALKNPMIAGTIAGSAIVSYIYYEYLQYLERQKMAEKEKTDSKNQENKDSIKK